MLLCVAGLVLGDKNAISSKIHTNWYPFHLLINNINSKQKRSDISERFLKR